MTRKIIILLEIIFCVLAVVIISVVGNNPETWRDYQPVTSLEFVNSSTQTNPFETDETGDKTVTIEWGSEVAEIEYQLSWEILPTNATITEIELTLSIQDVTIVSVSEDGLITFKSRTALLNNGCSITIKTVDITNKTDTLYFDFTADGGGVILPP